MLKKNLRNSLLLSALSFSSIAEEGLKLSDKWAQVTNRPSFVSNEGQLIIPIPYPEIQILAAELEKRDGTKLVPQQQGHLKVVTNSEWRILNQRLSMDDLEKLATKYSMMKMTFTPKCLAKVEVVIREKRDHSWVVVGAADEVMQLRREIWRFYMTKGGAGPEFQWKKWHPVVTVASTTSNFDDDLSYREKPVCAIVLTMTP